MTSNLNRSVDDISSDLAAERAALNETLLELRQRLSPRGLVQESAYLLRERASDGALSSLSSGLAFARQSKATPWIAGAALAGVAVAIWAKKANEKPEEVPLWLAEIRRAGERADRISEEIWQAADEGLLSEDDLEQARLDIDRALQIDTRRALLSGLEGLAPEERDAALAVREARLNKNSKGGNALLKGVLLASATAGAAALVQRLGDGGKSESLLEDVKAGLDQALRRFDLASSRQDRE